MKPSPDQIDELEIDSILSFIPATDRSIWIQVGMGLKDGLGNDGYARFDKWSKSANNYSSKSVRAAWESFRGEGVTVGTIYYLAEQHGFRRQRNSYTGTKTPIVSPSRPPVSVATSSYGKQLFLASNRDDDFVAAHLYAEQKGILSAGGAGRRTASGRIIGKNEDCIIVPIRNIESDRVQGVECINPAGRKQTFGQKSGGALILGNSKQRVDPWFVLEGWASTYSTVFHHEMQTAVCSFGKGQQEKVAAAIDEFHRPNEIIILEEVD